MSKVSDAKLADGIAEPELVKESSKEEEEEDDELRHLHDIEHLGEDIKNKISSAGLSGPTLVDDLFRSFLAKKMEDVESEHKKKKKKSSKEKRDDEDGAKSRKHKKKHKKKHKSKSSRKRSRSRVSSDCIDQNSKLDQRSESNHCDSNIGSDTGLRSIEGVGHEQKSVTDKCDANNLGTSLGAEITESNRTVYHNIESTSTDVTQHRIDAETEEEKGPNAKPFDDFKDDEERICKNVSDANCKHLDVNSLPSQGSHSKVIKHSCVGKESHDTCDNPVGRPGDLEAESIRRVLEPDEEHCNSPGFCQDQVHSVKMVRNEMETTDCGKESEDHRNRTVEDGNKTADHENRTEDHGLRTVDHGDRTEDHVNSIKDHGERAEDHGNSTEDHGNDFKASDIKPLSAQLSGNISRARSKEDTDFVSQSKDHSRKSKDLSKHSGSRNKDHSGRQSDKEAKGKSSSERKRHKSKSVDRDKKSKDHGSDSRDHGSQSKDHGSKMKDHGIQSKDHDRSSRDHGNSSKDHENRSRNHDDKSKDHGSHSKDNESRSRDHDSQSNDCPQHSTDRDNQHSADKTDSGDPQDRRQKSTERDGRSKDREQQSKERDGHLKDHGQQSTERDSRSKDCGHRSIASDTRSKNCRTRSSEKDVYKSEKKRDRSRSSDHRHKSRERDRRSKDCHRQSKDRSAHGSEVDRDHSRSNRSDRKKDRSGSVEFRRRSKDRSRSVDRQKRRSREKSISVVDSDDDSHRPRRLKSKKQKHKKRRERSVEIIEDDDMESPEASEKLTERLLKRLNTSIKRGQELKEEKDALLDPKMSLGIEVVDLEESDCGGEEERAKEHAGDLEGAVVSTSGVMCERLSGVAASTVDALNVDISSICVPAPVQGPDAEAGSRTEKAHAVLASTAKPSLGKTKKPLMKMGIRLTESSMAIISSGVMAEPEQKVKAEDEGH